jgi:hypothetical protein
VRAPGGDARERVKAGKVWVDRKPFSETLLDRRRDFRRHGHGSNLADMGFEFARSRRLAAAAAGQDKASAGERARRNTPVPDPFGGGER